MPTDLCELLSEIHREGHVDASSWLSGDDKGMFGSEVGVDDEVAIVLSLAPRANSF